MSFERVSEQKKQSLINTFSTLEIDLLENPSQFFKHIGLLDVFDRCLNEQEALELLSPIEQHLERYSPNFHEFFRRIYKMNGLNPIYVKVNFPFEDDSPYKNRIIKSILKRLNNDESYMFRELMTYKETIFKISDYKHLTFLVSLSTSELCFSDFLFPHLETVVLGNYDLSFPLYCNDDANFNRIRKIASDTALHIRQSQ